MNDRNTLELFRKKIREMVDFHGLDNAEISVTVKPLTPEEALGAPQRTDFPILEGRERVIEAAVLGSRGQAFTDSPACFTGRLGSVMGMSLVTNRDRAVFLAAANAVLAHLGMARGTVHCKDEDPERCAAEMARMARDLGIRCVGLIGLNPAIAEALAKEFGAGNVTITDLNPKNINHVKYGVPVWDGKTQAPRLISYSDLVVITGTSLVNGTFDNIMGLVNSQHKMHVLYGITAAGFCGLMDAERWCFRAQNGGQR
ncbi:hypothetical protein HY768_00530 [candidate division TA06 bacterium]|uniref:Putative heavy-metal chelation domain-containing protein n=1 Tax=candidate division TA06 bacterium TaxID=2250710 RepID=A0A933IC09_UNCT6|nr:hypothetical protein [candidate division TA06 bacterium]